MFKVGCCLHICSVIVLISECVVISIRIMSKFQEHGGGNDRTGSPETEAVKRSGREIGNLQALQEKVHFLLFVVKKSDLKHKAQLLRILRLIKAARVHYKHDISAADKTSTILEEKIRSLNAIWSDLDSDKRDKFLTMVRDHMVMRRPTFEKVYPGVDCGLRWSSVASTVSAAISILLGLYLLYNHGPGELAHGLLATGAILIIAAVICIVSVIAVGKKYKDYRKALQLNGSDEIISLQKNTSSLLSQKSSTESNEGRISPINDHVSEGVQANTASLEGGDDNTPKGLVSSEEGVSAESAPRFKDFQEVISFCIDQYPSLSDDKKTAAVESIASFFGGEHDLWEYYYMQLFASEKALKSDSLLQCYEIWKQSLKKVGPRSTDKVYHFCYSNYHEKFYQMIEKSLDGGYHLPSDECLGFMLDDLNDSYINQDHNVSRCVEQDRELLQQQQPKRHELVRSINRILKYRMNDRPSQRLFCRLINHHAVGSHSASKNLQDGNDKSADSCDDLRRVHHFFAVNPGLKRWTGGGIARYISRGMDQSSM